MPTTASSNASPTANGVSSRSARKRLAPAQDARSRDQRVASQVPLVQRAEPSRPREAMGHAGLTGRISIAFADPGSIQPLATLTTRSTISCSRKDSATAPCHGTFAPLSCRCRPQFSAAPITIFNTGVDPSANALIGPGVPDPHYSLIVQPGAATAVTVDATIWPIFGGPWVPNNSGSRWIGPDASSNGPPGTYVYRTTFNVPINAVLSTVNVSGDWGTDDNSLDIEINGNSTGLISGGFTTLPPFSITSGFVFGTNTLDFHLNNAGGPTGLRVDHIAGSYQVIPEPTSVVLLTLGLAFAAGSFTRRRT